MTKQIVLVPGFWLGGWAWDAVADDLRARGNAVTALTLPGLRPGDDRSTVTLDDQASAILAAASDGAVLVGHSGGGYAVYAALDRAPEHFARAIYVDSGPVSNGFVFDDTIDDAAVEVPLPSWADLRARGTSLDGLDDAMLAEFRERAVPEPADIARTPKRFTNPRRRTVPTTVVCCSFGSETVKQMRDAGVPMAAELQHVDADYVDLPTGHWPMWSKPHELADVIHLLAGG